ncbi:uncharacterized protein LOC132461261 [Gadus macrocephalus]|uniref:uncharacterized protein LOC132461261 n=1 Tax=Gadus macrocephalus TaxID=80720 RepID=UPI0028CB274E|nr:uncharacterized protein LOC132461261 [Gadus macrocephalus]
MQSSSVMLVVLFLGVLCRAAPPSTEMVTLEVELGAMAIFPCNGSSFLGLGAGGGPGGPGGEEEDEGGLFVWEAMGKDVVAFKDGAMVEGSQYEGRVHLASEDSVLTGDWSLVLEGVRHADVNMYECIVPGRRTLANVWLSVEPPEGQTLWVNAWLGDSTYLSCEAPEAERSQDLRFWWEKDGVPVPHDHEDEDRFHVETDGNHVGLIISQVLITDRGVYHCFFQSRPSPEPRRGSPEIVKLTVLGSEHLDDEEMGPEATPSTEPSTPQDEEEEVPTPSDPTLLESPLLLSDDTLGGQDNSHGDDVPWVRITIMTSVLTITAVTLCILRARYII